MDDQIHDFEVLLEGSSLGAPGAQLLRGRTSRSQARAIRRIGELRNRNTGENGRRAEPLAEALPSGLPAPGRIGSPRPAGVGELAATADPPPGLSSFPQSGRTGRPGPVVPRIQLGSQLRQLRLARGITLRTASDCIHASETKMSRMELGRVGCKKRDVENLLTLYGITDEQARAVALSLAEAANSSGWWQRYSDMLPSWWSAYLGLEGATSLIRAFEVQHVHALLQIEDYAHVVCRQCTPGVSQADVERRVALRLERQQALVAEDACELHVVLDESALLRSYGNRAVMRRQLQHLFDASERPNIRLQVMPFHSAGHPVASGPFTVFSFSQAGLSDIVHMEQLTSALYLDKPADVAQFRRIYEELQRDSPAPEESRDLLRGLLMAT